MFRGWPEVVNRGIFGRLTIGHFVIKRVHGANERLALEGRTAGVPREPAGAVRWRASGARRGRCAGVHWDPAGGGAPGAH